MAKKEATDIICAFCGAAHYKIVGDGVAVLRPTTLHRCPAFKESIKNAKKGS